MFLNSLKKLSVFCAIFATLSLCTPFIVRAEEDAALAQKRKEAINAAKNELNNTSWKIVLNNMATKAHSEDVLDFSGNKIESKDMSKKGFSASNFTISVENENIVVWETMQTSEKEGLAFWRAEVEGGVMRGVLSRHLKDKTTEDYTFFSTSKESTSQSEASSSPIVKEEPKVETAPVAEVEAKHDVAVEKTKKAKKKDSKR